MNKFEYKVKLAEEIIEERETINRKYLSLEVENVKQLRSLIIQFVIISSAIIGFSLPVFGNTNLVKNSSFLVGGLGELLIVVVFGFFHLNLTLQKENNDLKLDHTVFSDFLDKKRDAKVEFMNNMEKPESFDKYENAQKKAISELDKNIEKPSNRKDFSLDVIFMAFFTGLVLIVLSMVNFNQVYQFFIEVI